MLTLVRPQLHELKGTGAFGKVFRASWNRKDVAVKIINTQKHGYSSVLCELEALSKIPITFSVCQCFGWYVADATSIGIIMELLEVELFDVVIQNNGLQESKCQEIFKDVFEAVHYMHSINLVHCDIKLENLMIDNGGKVRIIDFGMLNTNGKFGTTMYAAPETWSCNFKANCLCDIWALGICLFATKTATFPWEKAHIGNANYKNMLETKLPFTKAMEAIYKIDLEFSLCLSNLLNHMVQPHVPSRYDIKWVCSSKWTRDDGNDRVG